MANQAGRALHRIFVSNIPWTVSGRELSEYFSQFGHVTSARVIFDKTTGMSQRYGFVDFSSKSAFEGVVNKKDHTLEGSFLSVNPKN